MDLNRNQWIAIFFTVIVTAILAVILGLTYGPQWIAPDASLLFPMLNLVLSPLIILAVLLVPIIFFLRWGWPEKFPMVAFMLPLRLALGWEFLHGGLDKLLDPAYATNYFLFSNAIANAPSPWIQGFMSMLLVNGTSFLLLIAWGELLIGLSLTFGLFTRLGSIGGILMQWAFFFLLGWMSASTFGVNFIGQIAFFVVGMYQAGRYIGLDKWVGPWLNDSKNAFLKFLGWWT
ncbi:MAG: TQO small subunit DoxD [Promethearchaeota archaeon]